MNRTEQLLEDLRRLDPLRDDVQGDPSTPRVIQAARPARRRLVVGAALASIVAAVLLAVVALNPDDGSEGVVAAAVATAADHPPVELAPDQYAYRSEQWFQASLPGQIAAATPEGLAVLDADGDPPPRTGKREVWFSPRDRGKVEGEDGKGWPACTAADRILDLATNQTCWSDVGGPKDGLYGFEQPPAIRHALQRIAARRGRPTPYWEFSPDIAKLGTDPNKIDRAVRDRRKELERQQPDLFDFQTGERPGGVIWDPHRTGDPAFELEAVADLLANPLAPPEVRAALFRYAGTIDGVETSADATDSQGRSGASIAVTSVPADPRPILISDLPSTITEPFSQYAKDGYRLDLSGLHLRTELIFDADTSELLAERTQLLSADDPLFGPWLERKGAPQTIYERTFGPIAVVDSTHDRSGHE